MGTGRYKGQSGRDEVKWEERGMCLCRKKASNWPCRQFNSEERAAVCVVVVSYPPPPPQKLEPQARFCGFSHHSLPTQRL